MARLFLFLGERQQRMIKHVDFDSPAWQVRMKNARSGEEFTALLFELPDPVLRYGSDAEIRLSSLQELEIRSCAQEIIDAQVLEKHHWVEISKIYPEAERTSDVESLIVILTDLAMKRLKTGYGIEDCPTLEEHLLMIWLEDCITLDPYIRRGKYAST